MAFSISTIFKAIDRITGPTRRMTRSISRMSRRASRSLKSVSRVVGSIGRGLRTATMAASIFGAAIGGAAADGINTYAQFEQALISAGAKFVDPVKKGTAAYDELEKTARRVGGTTEFTSTQAAEGLNFLAKAGFSAQLAIAALPGMVDLATAAELDLARATDIATDVMGAFNLTSKDAAQNTINLTRVSDALARTVTSANVDMEDLFETVKGAGAIANETGQSIESFAALAGILGGATIKGGMAATAMKNAFVRLADAGGPARKMLKRLRVDVADGEGNFRNYVDILADVSDKLKGVGQVERLGVLNEIFGLRAIAGGATLLKKLDNGLRDYIGVIENAEGSTARMAATIRDSLNIRMKIFQSTVESLKISIVKLKLEGIEGIIEASTKWVRKLDLAIQANEELASGAMTDLFNIIKGTAQLLLIFTAAFVTMKVVVLAAQFAIILFNIALFATKGLLIVGALLIAGLSKAFVVLRGAMLALSIVAMLNPLGAILVVIGLITVGAVLLIKNWKKLGPFFAAMWNGIKNTFTKSVDFIKKLLNIILDPIKLIQDGLAGFGGKVNILLGGGDTGTVGTVGPGAETARSIIETNETSESTIVIRDETGRAEFENPQRRGPFRLQTADTGGF